MKRKLEFRTAYHQFYILDKGTTGDTGADDFWSESAFSNRLAVTNGLLAISTASYGRIQLEITLSKTPKELLDTTKFDHIVEGGLVVQSGSIEIADCPNQAIEMTIHVVPGSYRVRVYSTNLSGVFDDDGDDYYHIEIWPDNNLKVKVLKQYDE